MYLLYSRRPFDPRESGHGVSGLGARRGGAPAVIGAMSVGVTIRTIERGEWREYKKVRLRALQDSPDAFGSTYEQSILIENAAWQARLENVQPERDHPLVACAGDEFVGLAWVQVEPENLTVAHLYQMWVAPSVRGRGVGQALVERAIDWARQADCQSMLLQVTAGDRPARRLYARLGFRAVGGLVLMREEPELFEQTMVLDLISSLTSDF